MHRDVVTDGLVGLILEHVQHDNDRLSEAAQEVADGLGGLPSLVHAVELKSLKGHGG